MSFRFEIEARDGNARAGRLFTPHGEVATPVFMPVGTVATVKGVPQDVLEELGVQILLNNTYHLYLRPGVETIRRLGGVQRFMAWDRPILTDSGGFQVFSLSDLRNVTEEGVAFRSHLDGSSHFFSPESSIAAQIGLGADIIMAFDECTEHPAEYARTRDSMEMTLRWAARSKKYFEEHKQEVPWSTDRSAALQSGCTGGVHASGKSEGAIGTLAPTAGVEAGATCGKPATQTLFGIVQGGLEEELRARSAAELVALDFPGYAIGGLSVGESRDEMERVARFTAALLPAHKPRYLMGVGTVRDLVVGIDRGIDLFDCVYPTRSGRHGRVLTRSGAEYNIRLAANVRDFSPLDPECGCRVCATYTKAYLAHLFRAGELLAQRLLSYHNVAALSELVRDARSAIASGRWEAFKSRFVVEPEI